LSIGNGQYETTSCEGETATIQVCTDSACSSCAAQNYTVGACSDETLVLSCGSPALTVPAYQIGYFYPTPNCEGNPTSISGTYESFQCANLGCYNGNTENYLSHTYTCVCAQEGMPTEYSGFAVIGGYSSQDCSGSAQSFTAFVTNTCLSGVTYNCSGGAVNYYYCDSTCSPSSCRLGGSYTLNECNGDYSMALSCSESAISVSDVSASVLCPGSTTATTGSISTTGTGGTNSGTSSSSSGSSGSTSAVSTTSAGTIASGGSQTGMNTTSGSEMSEGALLRYSLLLCVAVFVLLV